MANKKNTRRALFMSVMSLILCFAMLMGTTFAWFTDSVASKNNIIQAGNLDIEMYYAEGKEDPDSVAWKDASTDKIFDYSLWEPAYTQVRHIKIHNAGSLALKYQLQIVSDEDISILADVIDVYYVEPAVQVTNRTDLSDAYKLGTLREVLAGIGKTANGDLISGESDVVTLALKMQETAGNEYQNLSIGTSFSVVLMATQYEAEDDSFGTDYDGAAYTPNVAPITVTEEIKSEGETKIVSGSSNATIPEGAAGDAESVTMNVEETPVNPNVTIETDEGAITFDLSFTDEEGKEIEFTEDVTVELFIGKNLKPIALYHYANNDLVYDYNPATGVISFNSSSFSPFTVVYAYGGGLGSVAAPYVIETEGHLSGALAENANIILANDITLETPWTPVEEYDSTFDGDNHTIKGLSITSDDDAAFFYDLNTEAVVKNVKFENVNIKAKNAGVVAVNIASSTVENVHVLSGSVEGTSYAAAFAGQQAFYGASFKNCTNYADITAGSIAAGFGGYIWYDSEVENCVNYGNVTGGNRAGGIAAHLGGTMKDCTNNGEIISKGGMPAGGIVASISSASTIESCVNNGDVTNEGTDVYNSFAGGILGVTPGSAVTIKECVNNGNIVANNSNAAGIASSHYGSLTAINCENNGDVYGAKGADGIVPARGMFSGTNTVTDCVNNGEVTQG